MTEITEPKAFKSSDGNGGHVVTYDDKRRKKETIMSGIIIGASSALIVSIVSGIFVLGFNDRKEGLAAIASVKEAVIENRKELAEYVSIAGMLNDIQTDAINRNTEFLSQKYKWIPCPPLIPKMKELKKGIIKP